MHVFNHNLELPPELMRERVLTAAQAASFVGLSLSHFRRLHRWGEIAGARRRSTRRLGWRVADLLSWLEGRKLSSRDVSSSRRKTCAG
jgi:predicted DNA-binding transcriptional regulator AlpA